MLRIEFVALFRDGARGGRGGAAAPPGPPKKKNCFDF